MPDSAPDLPTTIAELKAIVASRDADLARAIAEIKSRDLLIEKLRHQLGVLRHHRFGARSESLDQLQLTLEEAEIAAGAEEAGTPAPEPPTETKAKPKRRPLPDHLPRTDEVLTPGEACGRCGGQLRTLAEDVTEELDYVPARFVVRRIIRPRMACKACEAICQAPLPSRPIERGRPGPGLLAHVLVSKYADHLPLYRQSQVYGREGVDLERSTLADWVGKSAALLEPLADAIGRHVFNGSAIFADDTPLAMLNPGAGKTRTARAWVYVRDERPWASEEPPAAFYRFTPDRKGQHPADHLARYQGWMHADGYAGFDKLCRDGRIKEVACLAHVRRKFVDIHRAQGSAIAEEAIKRIAALYAIEDEARGRPPDERLAIRQARAGPQIEDLEAWLKQQLPRISGKSPLATAIRYALTRLKKLRPYLDHGVLEIDNNTAERAIRGLWRLGQPEGFPQPPPSQGNSGISPNQRSARPVQPLICFALAQGRHAHCRP